MRDYIQRKISYYSQNPSDPSLKDFKIMVESLEDESLRKSFLEELGRIEEKFNKVYEKSSKFCYWSVGDGNHSLMLQTLIKSARAQGVKEDFHVWTDRSITGNDVFVHDCGTFNKDKYLFKFKFLQEVKKLDYEYFVFLDADNYFVRHPGHFEELLGDDKVFIQMENRCNERKMTRGDWWGCKIEYYPLLLWYHGVKSKTVWNTNAGFWIVKKEVIDEVCDKGLEFWKWCKENIKVEFTEEAPLAFLGHILQKNLEEKTLEKTSGTWCSDWTGQYKDRLPDGNSWQFEDYMSGEKIMVNPAIVHCMRSKEAMVKGI